MVVILALTMHVLADFYFQTDSIAKEKQGNWKVLIKHLVVYSICMLVAFVPFLFQMPLWSLFWAWVFLSGSHALIDVAKWRILKNTLIMTSAQSYKMRAAWLFFIDQVLHIVCIIMVQLFIPIGSDCLGSHELARILGEVTLQDITAVVLIALFLCKPASIMVRIVLECVQQKDDNEAQGIERAGAAIGILERLIIAVFTLCGQPAAIAFVIAAKSLARFKQLEDQAFAERYLVGTLLSSLLALVTSLGVQLFLM